MGATARAFVLGGAEKLQFNTAIVKAIRRQPPGKAIQEVRTTILGWAIGDKELDGRHSILCPVFCLYGIFFEGELVDLLLRLIDKFSMAAFDTYAGHGPQWQADPTLLFSLRNARQFDTVWFDSAYQLGLAMAQAASMQK